jgi:high-affinity Fe2+/Pb2+ permease
VRSRDYDTLPVPLEGCVVLSLYDCLVTHQTKGDALMFASLTSKVVTAICAVVGAIALLGTFYLTVTGGSPYLQFALALIFFAMFIVGSYWWMVFGPGRGL